MKVYPITLVFIFFCTFIVTQGTKKSDKANQIFCLAKLAIVTLIVIVGFLNLDNKYFIEDSSVSTGEKVVGVFEGATLTFFGFIGFELGTTLIAEAQNPLKDIPRSIIYVVTLSSFVYVLAGFAITGIGIGPISRLYDADTALAISFEMIGIKWMGQVVYIAAIFGVTACSLAMINSQTRVNYALSKDGLFYPVFSIIDETTMVPKLGAWIIAIPIALIAFCLDLTQIAKLSSCCSLQQYMLMGCMFLQYRLRGGNLSSQSQQMSNPKSSEIFILTWLILCIANSLMIH